MKTKNHSGLKALVGGLVVCAAGIGMLTTTGCDRLPTERVAALSAGSPDVAGAQFGSVVKPDQRSRLVLNHNETFLIGASV